MRDEIVTSLCLGLVLAALPLPARAQEGGEAAAPGNEPEAASSDAIAKELSNPAGSLASLKNNFEYLGNGWQLASSPIITHDWEADGGEAWAVPIGVGLAKTTALGSMPLKLQLEGQEYMVQPDAVGPDWLFKLTITPVIENPFLF